MSAKFIRFAGLAVSLSLCVILCSGCSVLLELINNQAPPTAKTKFAAFYEAAEHIEAGKKIAAGDSEPAKTEEKKKEKELPEKKSSEGLPLESGEIIINGDAKYVEDGDSIKIVPKGAIAYIDAITTSHIDIGFMYDSQKMYLTDGGGEEYSPTIVLQNGRIRVTIPSGCTLHVQAGKKKINLGY